MSTNTIKDIIVNYYKVPLENVLVDALHGNHFYFELITATVVLEDGSKGCGYTYTGGWGGAAIAVMIEQDLKKALVGKTYEKPMDMMIFMNKAIHYVARGGIASFAISAVDTALWDIQCKKLNLPLCKLLSDDPQKVRTYYGGIDLGFTKKELLANIEKQFEAGHAHVKIKLGKSDYKEDVDRVKAVRQLIGKEATFMVDANMVWDAETAITVAKEIEQYDIYWIEEPCNPDLYEDYARVSENSNIPIAMGENMHTFYEHRLAVEYGKVSEIITDASNLCGVSGVMQVQQYLEEKGMDMSTHGMQELHVNILAGIKNMGWLEFHSFPIWQYTIDKLEVKDGYVMPNMKPGVGVEFDLDILNQYEVK